MTGEPIMANGQISAVEVAVLAERVDRVLINYDELRGLILAQNAQLSQVPLIAQRINDLDLKTERIFTALRDHSERIGALEKSDHSNKVILRLTGAILLCSVSLIGWGWRQGTQLYGADSALDRRILLIEYKLGVAPTPNEGTK